MLAPSISELPLPASADLNLRPWTLADIPVMTEACQDEQTQRWTLVPANYTPAHARVFIAETERRLHRGESAELAIAAPSDPQLVLGSIGLMHLDWRAGTGEIGYWIAPAARRRGLATAAVRLVTDWAFSALGLSRLHLKPIAGNVASASVASRAGYKYQGIHHAVAMPKRGPTDVLIYTRHAEHQP